MHDLSRNYGSSLHIEILYITLTVLPSNIGVEGGDLWVEFLVAADEGVLVDLPDLAVVVPCRQVVLQVGGISLHTTTHLQLDLVNLLVLSDH